MTRTRILAALVAGLTLAGAGTAAVALADGPTSPASTPTVGAVADTTTFRSTPTTDSTTTVTTAATTTTTAPAPGGTTTGEEAGRIAVQHLGGGTVTKVEREVEHGRSVWEVDVRRGTGTAEVHVDVATGALSRVEDRSGGSDDGSGRGRGGDRARDDRGGDDRGGDDRGGDDRHGGRHGSDDGPGHDLFDDRGGDR